MYAIEARGDDSHLMCGRPALFASIRELALITKMAKERKADRALQGLAADLVRQQVAVIVASGSAAVVAASATTATSVITQLTSSARPAK
jgi:hypothetical protein